LKKDSLANIAEKRRKINVADPLKNWRILLFASYMVSLNRNFQKKKGTEGGLSFIAGYNAYAVV
jgi:hypothetical protein